jgi:uncharacterized repeat protein (TIGR01451 family)
MRSLIGIVVALLGVYASGAHAVDVPAGTVVTNTASVQYTVSSTTLTQTASANFTVQQIINVAITWQNGTDVSVTPGASNQALLFKVTNTGNGTDSFKLAEALVTPGGLTFTPAGCQIYFDTANTGVFDSSDVLYTAGTNDPSLPQGGAQNMLIVCNVPNTAVDTSLGEMKLTATSKTASGAVGTVDAGGGVGGVTAIVGLTGGTASATGIYQLHQIAFGYVLSQVVTPPGGGTQVVSGSTITYTLTVTPNGSATANNLVVTDPVPANTTFVPNSITLNGSSVTPVTGDYNVTTPGAVTVKLGNLAGTASAQIVKFQVQIN